MSKAALDHRDAVAARLGSRSPTDLDSGTIVVVPSITFPGSELRKIVGIEHYEERLLCLVLLLRNPGLRVVFASSVPLDPHVVGYYLSHIPDPGEARRRLTLVELDDPSPRALTEKLLADREALDRLAAAAGDGAAMLTFNVTDLEMRCAREIGALLYGPHPDLAGLGSKSGARRIAAEAGVPLLPGTGDVYSTDDLRAALAELHGQGIRRAVVKLNHGFSGQGNALVDIATVPRDPTSAPTVFCASEESWDTYLPKLAREGGVVEEHLRHPGAASPSVQMRVLPDATVEIVSTHDQLLGGPDDQVYLGCSFPARRDYRGLITELGLRIGKALAGRGVMGPFGIDFVLAPGPDGYDAYLSEINLRMGGTTHPFLMAHMVTGARYDTTSGELLTHDGPRCYVASDNLKDPAYKALSPRSLTAALDEAGLGWDPTTSTGVLPHLMGALGPYGKVGATCVDRDPAAAHERLDALEGLLGRLVR